MCENTQVRNQVLTGIGTMTGTAKVTLNTANLRTE